MMRRKVLVLDAKSKHGRLTSSQLLDWLLADKLTEWYYVLFIWPENLARFRQPSALYRLHKIVSDGILLWTGWFRFTPSNSCNTHSAFPLRVEWPEREADQLSPLTPRLRMRGQCSSHMPSYRVEWCILTPCSLFLSLCRFSTRNL